MSAVVAEQFTHLLAVAAELEPWDSYCWMLVACEPRTTITVLKDGPAQLREVESIIHIRWTDSWKTWRLDL